MTVGGKTSNKKDIVTLIKSGMNIARINAASINDKELRFYTEKVRRSAYETQR